MTLGLEAMSWTISLLSPTRLTFCSSLSEQPVNKLCTNIMDVQIFMNNSVHSRLTNCKLCSICKKGYPTVLIQKFAHFVHKIRRPDVPLPPTPLLIPHFHSAILELLLAPEHSCTTNKSLSICTFYYVKCFCIIFTKLNTKFYLIATLQVVFKTWLHAVHWSLWQATCDLLCSWWCPSRLLQSKKIKLGTCVHDNCGKDIIMRTTVI